ncbi:hypothetical protein D3C86_1796990 [compost metagenome]
MPPTAGCQAMIVIENAVSAFGAASSSHSGAFGTFKKSPEWQMFRSGLLWLNPNLSFSSVKDILYFVKQLF